MDSTESLSAMDVSANGLSQPSIDFFLPNMSDNVWKSDYEFNPAGMQMVYFISNLSLSAIFPPYDQYLGYAKNYEEMLNISTIQWEQMVWDNKGPLAFVLSAAVFIILLTLWGLIWCCCKCYGSCCSSCSSKDPDDILAAKMEHKNDKCKRNFCGVIFATLVVLFMFGLVCCFVTNEQMRLSVERMPQDVDNSLADVNTYLNTTDRQINSLFKENYALLSTTLNHILDQSGEIIKNGLSRRTGAQTLNNLTDILDTVDNVRQNVVMVEKTSKSLKDKVERLKTGLTDSKNRLLSYLEQCPSRKCTELRNMPEIRSLRVQNEFQNLPNMTEILRELGMLLGTDVRRSIDEGRKAFNELGIRIKTEVEPVLPEIRITIDDTGKELAVIANSLTKALSSIPIDESRDKVEETEIMIEQYAPYRYYAVLGVCLTLAFIFALFSFGIFVGFCGRQPGAEYSNECCSRKTGSSFLNCGIFFIFLTGGALMAVAVAHFMLAGTLTQVICEAVYAQDNRTEEAFRLPKLTVNSRYNYQVPPYNEIVRECSKGSSAYVAFQLKPVYDIENITALADRFKRNARRLANQVSLPDDATENIVFLSANAKQQLSRFSKSKINRIKFDAFANQLEESIISVDLRDVINRFNETVEDADNVDMPSDIKNRLQLEILTLETMQEKILEPMILDVKSAADSLRFLFEQQKDLSTRVESVIIAAERAQEVLHTSGAEEQVRELAREFEGEFIRHVEDYANFTYKSIRDDVGRCDSLYNALNATTNTFCHKIGSPLAAFWFSLTCLLILFFPLLIVGMILSRLYKKYKYLGYERSGETYYSTYGDGDTIPLSLSANGRRHKRGREPSQSASSAAATRFPARFEDTSQNGTRSVERILGLTSPAGGDNERHIVPDQPIPRSNIRFIDTPHDRSMATAVGSKRHVTPPPTYTVAVRHLKNRNSVLNNGVECEPLTLDATDTEDDSNRNDPTVIEAWGSQLVFNNHHTPPTSGEYERPPPYYYPGPAT